MNTLSMKTTSHIEIVGASAHNLKNIDVSFATRELTLIAGVSGSGKSSLLVNTLAAEGYRRMRRFLSLPLDWPEDEEPSAFIGPLSACVHTAQRSFRATRRTTVATASGMMSLLRRLFIAHGHPYCKEIDSNVPAPSATVYAQWLQRHYQGRATIWAVPAFRLATNGVAIARRLVKLGFLRAIVRSETDSPAVFEKGRDIAFKKWHPLSADTRHFIEVKVGVFNLPCRDDVSKSAFAEGLERAFAASQGHVLVELHDAAVPKFAELKGSFGFRLDSRMHHVHPESPFVFAPPNTHLLSFNQPGHERSGACALCQGTGNVLDLDLSVLIADRNRSMHDGALALWTKTGYKHINIRHETIEGLRGIDGFSPDAPWKSLAGPAKNLVLNGSAERSIVDRHRRTGRQLGGARSFLGFKRAIVERIHRGGTSAQSLNHYAIETLCPECNGSRWSRQARALQVGEIGLEGLAEMPFLRFETLCAEGGPLREFRSEPHVEALNFFTDAFVNMGLGHLSGNRGMNTLSEGEKRRLRLACLMNLGSSGLTLLLDEPSRGLHEQDLSRLIASLGQLKKSHTLIVSDHRRMLARAADSVVVLGPGAGNAGGGILYRGSADSHFWQLPKSAYHRAKSAMKNNCAAIRIKGGSIHNIEQANCTIPLGRLTCITGVSGSGKSSFVRGVLVPALATLVKPLELEVGDFVLAHGRWEHVQADRPIAGILALDQKIPPPNCRSLVLTTLDLAEALRLCFARTPDAKRLNLTHSDFGLNAGGGRCLQCLGLGRVEQVNQWTVCAGCGGKRFADLVLSVRVAGLNFAEVLDLPLEEIFGLVNEFFPQQAKLLEMACDLGLSHLSLGQRVDQLSGGELQRLRIANKLWPAEAKDWIIILDEPTAGLHPADIDRLLAALDRIVSAEKNTLVLVEHNIELIRQADWIVELGPGGGPAGGRVLACATPDDLRSLETPTARAMRDEFLTAVGKVALHDPQHEHAIATADSAHAWLRVLLGLPGDPPFEEDFSSLRFENLTTRTQIVIGAGDALWEIGGLNIEIVGLLLGLNSLPPIREQVHILAEMWAENPSAALWINPYIGAIHHWGLAVPRSTLQTTETRLQELGISSNKELRSVMPTARVTGSRFVPEHATVTCLKQKINHALVLGEGFVELRTLKGHAMGSACDRLLRLEEGLAAPLSLSVMQFLRHHSSGRCLMCKGEGSVPMLKLDLLIAGSKLTPDAERFYTSQTADIIRWIRRSIQIPFFRRLEEEGLWDSDTSFARFSTEARETFLWGFWRRPGHGSFLVKSKADPEVVSSWLRWDGLFAYVLEQVGRSTDPQWTHDLLESRTNRQCPKCSGSGLSQNANLLYIGNKSLNEWISRHTIGEFVAMLSRQRISVRRHRRTQERILECLSPLAKECGQLRVNSPAHGLLQSAMTCQRVIKAFTHLKILE
jgi:excinuclease ABC A subunit